MDSLQLSELQTFFSNNKGELTSRKLFESVDLLDPILERTLDLSEYITCTTTTSSHEHTGFNISTHISSDITEAQSSLPQAVLDATALVHEEKYPGEGCVLPPTMVNFLEPQHSPVSDVTSYYSDDSNSGTTQTMPEFSQLTSPAGADGPSTSGFQWPCFGQVKRNEFGLKAEDFRLSPCQISSASQLHDTSHHHHHSSIPSSMSDGISFPFVTSPSTSLPSPTSTIYSASSPGTPGPCATSAKGRRPHGSSAPYSKLRRRLVEKGTQEYVEKRTRNNVAVRKSRAKAREKQLGTEHRVKSLLDHNDQLQKKVDLLTKELNVIKGLFTNVGASIPDEFLKLIGDS